MQTIKTLNEIDFKSNKNILIMASIISVDSDGDSASHKPFKVTIKLEDSGETFQVFSWKFDLLQTCKDLVSSLDVFKLEVIPSLYRDTEKQLRIIGLENSGIKSSKKILKTVDSDSIKSEIQLIVDKYIPSSGNSKIYKELIKNLVMENPKFWTWPAATKMHHAYNGGLAKHTLSTVKNAISLWENYQGSNLNIALIVAGSILHDIGKITEYNLDGTRTTYGNLIPHPISGYSKIFSELLKLGIDPEKDTYAIMLLHTVLSHHERLEFGAPCQPGIFEALIIARADCLDANIECVDSIINDMSLNKSSDKIFQLDGTRMFKWHN